MIKTEKNKNKGFTLIELLIVIAIIALLTSIVLASLKTARDKSIATKFRSEIGQLTSALELFRVNNNGKYPYEGGISGSIYSAYISNANQETSTHSGQLLSPVMSKYIKSLPKVPANTFTQTATSWAYHANNTSIITPTYRCVGDTKIPPYVILFTSQNPTTQNAFINLPLTEVYVGSWVTTTERCYSLK